MKYIEPYNTMTDFLPTSLRLGSGLKLELNSHQSLEMIVDISKLLIPTTPLGSYDSLGNWKITSGYSSDVSAICGIFQSFYDAPNGIKEELNEIQYSFGLEYSLFNNILLIRSGLNWQSPSKRDLNYFTLGLGLKYKIIELDISGYIPISSSIIWSQLSKLSLFITM